MAMANLTTVTSCAITASAAEASSSTTFSSSSTSRSYDVFINHRGPDVKLSFASHLYRRLRDHGLNAFLDKEEMEEGRKISSQIQEAIHGAYVQIAIFSPTYAESSWCLDELVLMKNSGATILPIFFNVDPSVVRYPEKQGAYAEALLKLQKKTTPDGKEPRYSSETIQNWRAALSDVADLSGFELKSFNGREVKYTGVDSKSHVCGSVVFKDPALGVLGRNPMRCLCIPKAKLSQFSSWEGDTQSPILSTSVHFLKK